MLDIDNLRLKINLLYRNTAKLNLYLATSLDWDPQRIKAEAEAIRCILDVIDEYLADEF